MLIITLSINGQVSANAVNTDWPLYNSIDIMKSEKGLQDEELNKGIVNKYIKLSFILMHASVPSSVVDVGVQFSWVDVKTGRLLVYSTSMRYTSVIV